MHLNPELRSMLNKVRAAFQLVSAWWCSSSWLYFQTRLQAGCVEALPCINAHALPKRVTFAWKTLPTHAACTVENCIMYQKSVPKQFVHWSNGSWSSLNSALFYRCHSTEVMGGWAYQGVWLKEGQTQEYIVTRGVLISATLFLEGEYGDCAASLWLIQGLYFLWSTLKSGSTLKSALEIFQLV